MAHNRILTLNLGYFQQNYIEHDPYGLTPDGTLNTERGLLASAALSARWQAESLPFLLQATVRRSHGDTRYNGYLQTGNVLTSYRAAPARHTRTPCAPDCLLRAEQIGSGPRLSNCGSTAGGANWQDFAHNAGLAGLRVQWRQFTNPEAAAAPWSFELEGAAGHMLSAGMSAPGMGFNQPLGKRDLWQLGATLGYDLAPQWRLSADARAPPFQLRPVRPARRDARTVKQHAANHLRHRPGLALLNPTFPQPYQ